MGERRFYLSEVTEQSYYYELTGAITESVLTGRIQSVIAYAHDHPTWELDSIKTTLINILLHGEGENGDDLRSPYDTQIANEGKYQTKLTPEEKAQFERAIGAEKARAHMEQPDPWEAWIEKMPYDGTVSSVWQNDLQEWLRQMPKR